MALAEFEEKSFEVPLSHQLVAEWSCVFAPGQVAESVLGFDAAMFCAQQAFWRLWGRSVPLGLIPVLGWWPEGPRPHDRLPQCNFNLFLQYKRSQKLERSNAAEWQHWKGPYFRYDIVNHQQAALEACATSLGSNGLVAYAAPAFISCAELFAHMAARTLVSETNFVEAAKLSSHSRYTYASAGTRGIAFSEPTEIPSVLLSEEGLRSRIREAAKMPLGRNVLHLASDAITNAMKKIWRDSDAERFERLLDEGVRNFDQGRDEDRETLRAYLRVTGFCLVVGWSWLVAGPV